VPRVSTGFTGRGGNTHPWRHIKEHALKVKRLPTWGLHVSAGHELVSQAQAR
jgi:hypothetical protein